MFTFLAIVAVAGLFITYAVYAYKKNQARLAALHHLVASQGWQFTPHDPWGLPSRWHGTPFNAGYDRRAENVITGEHQGHPLVAFDYSYKTDSTDSKGNRTTTTHRYWVAALGMPCALPELHVGPEGVFSRIGKAVGFQDIELESEDFNRAFRVRCPDAKLATDILTPRTMEMMLASGAIKFRFVGTDAVAYDNGCLEAHELVRAAHVLANVVDGVPSFVWRDYGLPESPQARPATPSPRNLT
jgi:hypothetical protein